MGLTGTVSWEDGEPLVGATVEIRGPQRRRVRHWEYTRSLHLLCSTSTTTGGRFEADLDASPCEHLSVLVKTRRNGIVFVGRLKPGESAEAGHTIVVPRDDDLADPDAKVSKTA